MNDFTGDGYADIVSGKYFYRNPGTDMIGKWKRSELPIGVDALLAFDADADIIPDVIAMDRTGKVYWLEATGNNVKAWRSQQIGDMGQADHKLSSQGYALAQIVPGGPPEVILNVGEIHYFKVPDLPEKEPWRQVTIAADAYGEGIGTADINGKLDIVTRNQSSFGNPSGNRFHVWRQQTPDNWSGLEVECPHGEGIKLSDLDRDGDLDVIIGMRWYENTGDILKGPWTEHVYSTLWKHADTEVQCHDLNNDGRLDIVLTPAELKGGIYHISWFEAPEDAKTPNWREHVIEEVQETVVHALGVADINNDGKADVAIAEMHQGADPDEVRVYLNQGGGLTWTREVLSTTGSHDIVLADIGADGDVDIVGANHAGSFQAVQLWENLTSTTGKGHR